MRVTAALETLAERRVSGILEIDGNPAGSIYLDQGEITFARAMVQAGLCARCARPEGPAGPLAQWFGNGAGEPPVLSPAAVLPPQPELLRRVLDGLRRLG